MRKRTTIQEKTFYTIEQGRFGIVKDKNVENVLLTSEDINDINWYMENVMHVKSEGVYDLDNHTKQESEFFLLLGSDKYFIMKARLKFGYGQRPITSPDKIKQQWEKIRKHYIRG